jgi:arylsulfatase A-like enzyme
MKKHTNILFITTDQQQKKTLGAYGNSLIKTPNLDKLAQSGMILERAYCENPICIPSRNTMITGRKSVHHQASQHNSSLPDNQKCLGDLLQKNNYTTHFIGKPHFKSQQARGTEESIEDWMQGLYEDWNGPYAGFETADIILGHSNPLTGHYGQWMRKNHKDKIQYFKKENLKSADVQCGHGVYRTEIPESVHSSTYVADRTVEFIRKSAKEEKPFYCFSSFPDPHWPLMTPPEYYDMYKDTPIDVNYPSLNDDPNLDNYPVIIKEYLKTGVLPDYDGGGERVPDDHDIEVITRAYWGSISLIDKSVGRIIDALNESGIREETLVVFTADHGEYMGAHGMMTKGGICWEEYINVPFIASYPGKIKENRRSSALFSFTDLVPTFVDIAGLEKEDGIPLMPWDGCSQKDLFFGDKQKIRETLTVHHVRSNLKQSVSDQHILIRDDGWKLVYFARDAGGQLYDLKADPREARNLYNLPESRERQITMEKELLDHLIMESDIDPVIQRLTCDSKYAAHVLTADDIDKGLKMLI